MRWACKLDYQLGNLSGCQVTYAKLGRARLSALQVHAGHIEVVILAAADARPRPRGLGQVKDAVASDAASGRRNKGKVRGRCE